MKSIRHTQTLVSRVPRENCELSDPKRTCSVWNYNGSVNISIDNCHSQHTDKDYWRIISCLESQFSPWPFRFLTRCGLLFHHPLFPSFSVPFLVAWQSVVYPGFPGSIPDTYCGRYIATRPPIPFVSISDTWLSVWQVHIFCIINPR